MEALHLQGEGEARREGVDAPVVAGGLREVGVGQLGVGQGVGGGAVQQAHLQAPEELRVGAALGQAQHGLVRGARFEARPQGRPRLGEAPGDARHRPLQLVADGPQLRVAGVRADAHLRLGRAGGHDFQAGGLGQGGGQVARHRVEGDFQALAGSRAHQAPPGPWGRSKGAPVGRAEQVARVAETTSSSPSAGLRVRGGAQGREAGRVGAVDGHQGPLDEPQQGPGVEGVEAAGAAPDLVAGVAGLPGPPEYPARGGAGEPGLLGAPVEGDAVLRHPVQEARPGVRPAQRRPLGGADPLKRVIRLWVRMPWRRPPARSPSPAVWSDWQAATAT